MVLKQIPCCSSERVAHGVAATSERVRILWFCFICVFSCLDFCLFVYCCWGCCFLCLWFFVGICFLLLNSLFVYIFLFVLFFFVSFCLFVVGVVVVLLRFFAR